MHAQAHSENIAYKQHLDHVLDRATPSERVRLLLSLLSHTLITHRSCHGHIPHAQSSNILGLALDPAAPSASTPRAKVRSSPQHFSAQYQIMYRFCFLFPTAQQSKSPRIKTATSPSSSPSSAGSKNTRQTPVAKARSPRQDSPKKAPSRPPPPALSIDQPSVNNTFALVSGPITPAGAMSTPSPAQATSGSPTRVKPPRSLTKSPRSPQSNPNPRPASSAASLASRGASLRGQSAARRGHSPRSSPHSRTSPYGKASMLEMESTDTMALYARRTNTSPSPGGLSYSTLWDKPASPRSARSNMAGTMPEHPRTSSK